MDRFEVRLSGAGGQGMILAGIIIAEAALHEEGLNVTQTQSYGPESRGGASRSEVVLSKEVIDFPKVIKPDILVALTQKAYDKYNHDVKEDGIIIVDDSIDIDEKKVKTHKLPIFEKAIEEVEMKLSANILVLGIVDSLLPQIRTSSLKKAIKKRVPENTIAVNMKAFAVGQELAKGGKIGE
uniref:Pyruvate/ketoisovalerate oxidoreductase, gamma subunit n=1 Tax=uncultured organism TaxID=155900 RepID=M1QC49_9ZZZZ|nr:pyruvate/ketoisovalerate oxidoreductase, gamma subunit [uncultured organism]